VAEFAHDQSSPAVPKTSNAVAIVGWTVSLAGSALWTYGYFVPGSPSFFNWGSFTPWWIADFLPNSQSEIGMLFAFAGMIPIYWPSARNLERRDEEAKPTPEK
jgi:hypothetical protein